MVKSIPVEFATSLMVLVLESALSPFFMLSLLAPGLLPNMYKKGYFWYASLPSSATRIPPMCFKFFSYATNSMQLIILKTLNLSDTY
jgi:hypothetical protein